MTPTPTDPPHIVTAFDADLPAIAELAGVVWRACYPEMISAAQIDYMLARFYALTTMRREIAEEGVSYDCLRMGSRLAGFAAYGPVDPDTFKLHKLYLHPEYHGRGFGGRLLDHCEREARRRGAGRLTLNVNKRNARALALYRQHGFQTVTAVVLDIGGGFVMDDFVMARDLRS